MPTGLWIVVIVVLLVGAAVYLRRRSAAGDHETPAAPTRSEPAPRMGGYAGPMATPTPLTTATPETAAPVQPSPVVEAPALQEAADDHAPEAADEADRREQEELTEEADERHEDGYVETFGNERAVLDADGDAEDEAEPALTPEPPLTPEPAASPEPDLTPEPAETSESEDLEEPAQPEEPERPERPMDTEDVEPSEYGPGSALPASDGSGPRGWSVKGNADSLLYHAHGSPGFGRVAADVWFVDEDAATAAGFIRWDAHRR